MSSKIRFKKKISLALACVLVILMMGFQMTGAAANNTNVALDKPALCEGFTAGHDASLANDRSSGSYWEGVSWPTWWKVDLGEFYDIDEIRIVNEVNRLNMQKGPNKGGSKNNNYYQYTVYSSPDDIHWFKIAEKQGTEKANGSGETFRVYATWVRYLRVDMTFNSANAAVQIRDFSAYGEPSSDPGIGIGEGNISETRIDYPVAEGVTRTHITRGFKTDGKVATTMSGPWQVNVLTVDPETYAGLVQARLCGGYVSTTATVLDEAVSQGATAAVNGSFFTVSPSFNGTIGGSMGLFAVNGQVTNESINPRGAMLMPYGTVQDIRIGRFTSVQTAASSDGSSIAVNGINRMPGVKVGVEAGYAPLHDNEALFADEVILYTDLFGKATEQRLKGYSGSGYFKKAQFDNVGAEAVISATGYVAALYEEVGGHTIPEGCKIIAGIGTGAEWVRQHCSVGNRITFDVSLTCDGDALDIGPKASIVAAGPILMKNGAATTNEEWIMEGFKNATWNARNPRTLVGTRADGTLLIAVIDGRSADISVGASLAECQTVMKALGAVEVLNLDGGRSSLMTVGDQVVTNVIERREVGDILELLPRQKKQGR